MTIGTIALALAMSAAGGEAKEAPLFELVPVPPEYAVAPTPIPTPAASKAKPKARGKANGVPYPRGRNAPPQPSPPPMPVYVVPPPPSVAMPPPPPRPAGSRVAPRGSPGSWVVNDDYPAQAIRENMQGRVGFTLDVDSIGKVSACHVTRSSGWEILDQTTCALLKRRARFLPAVDSMGTPVPSTFSSRFRWVLPMDNSSAMAAWARVTHFAVSRDGEIMGCSTQDFGAPTPLEGEGCSSGQQPDEEGLAGLLIGSSGSRSLELVELHLPDGAALPEGFTMPAGTALATREVKLTVGEEGYVRRCEPGAEVHPELVERYMDRCAPGWTYPFAAGGDDRGVTLRVSLIRR